ncbi:MAG TPA: DHH family phosphoesterase [Methanomicrobia archaeon]|nr:DHH family phosphoesterase [Methanomicrobia archaeon]
MATLQKSVETAARIIAQHDFARVISHYDADGITAAGILCIALLRQNIQFHVTIVNKLEESFVQGLDDDLILICDMGTAQSDVLAEHLNERAVVIIDHHAPPASVPVLSTPSSVIINPCSLNAADARDLVNERGSTICAAGLSYLVARRLSGEKRGNIDLAGLAIAGTMGDKLDLNSGVNKLIVDEALREGVISIKRGLKFGDGQLQELINSSTDPYTPLTGKPAWVSAVLNQVKIEGTREVTDLTEDEEAMLTAALLALVRESQHAGISEDDLVGPTYRLHCEVIPNSYDLMRVIDACGRLGKSGLGLGLCLRVARLREEATMLYATIQAKLVSELNRLEAGEGAVKGLTNLYYFYVQEGGVTGTLAGIVADYLYTDKPVIGFNKKERVENGKQVETKISGRCNKKLIAGATSINLATAMERAAKEVGGFGGGHPVAAGASIPDGAEEKFSAILDALIGEQKK